MTATPKPGGRDRSPTGRPEQRTGGPTAARRIALDVLERVDRGSAYADLALHHALARSDAGAAERGLATELVSGSLRWRGRLDYVLARALDRPLDQLDPPVANVLRLAAYQLLFADRIPDRAAVDQAVRSARAAGAARAAGLVNAVLRRVAREHASVVFPALATDPVAHLVHALSLPPWIAERALARFGPDGAAAFALASNRPPALCVRTNPLRSDPASLQEALRPRFPDAAPGRFAPGALRLGHGGDPARDPAFGEGRFTVQDEASQLVVELLDPRPGESILDTCAAPGTKTTAIAERLGEAGNVLALDRNPRRLGLVERDAQRLGLNRVCVLARDATAELTDLPRFDDTPGDRAPARFDRVLVDAPCSGLGTLRRNPDARWRLSADDPARLAGIQSAILDRAAQTLGPGGCLVYSTCTWLPEENEAVIDRFVAEHESFRILSRSELPAAVAPFVDERGFMRCLPQLHDTDGFFAARLERTR